MEEQRLLRQMMERELPEGALREELAAMALPATYGSAIWLQLVKKAASGDLSAAKYVREAVEVSESAAGEDLRQVPTALLRKMLEQP